VQRKDLKVNFFFLFIVAKGIDEEEYQEEEKQPLTNNHEQ